MSSSSGHTKESGTLSKTQRSFLISMEAFLQLMKWIAGGLCWGLCAKRALQFRFPKLTDPSWNHYWTGTVIVNSYWQRLWLNTVTLHCLFFKLAGSESSLLLSSILEKVCHFLNSFKGSLQGKAGYGLCFCGCRTAYFFLCSFWCERRPRWALPMGRCLQFLPLPHRQSFNSELSFSKFGRKTVVLKMWGSWKY